MKIARLFWLGCLEAGMQKVRQEGSTLASKWFHLLKWMCPRARLGALGFAWPPTPPGGPIGGHIFALERARSLKAARQFGREEEEKILKWPEQMCFWSGRAKWGRPK